MNLDFFCNKRVVITGGTGSLGKTLCKSLLNGSVGEVIIVSRDEAKHHWIRERETWGKDKRLRMVLGDVRDQQTLDNVVDDSDVVVHAAALKQVPACEYAPWEAIQTNVQGAHNLVMAILRCRRRPSVVVGISTDKACKPVNAMGMTKALQERLLIHANLRMDPSETRVVCVRYGNVLASRGSVIPLFRQQIEHQGPVTITSMEMTRFLLSLDHAVDTISMAAEFGDSGEIWVPHVPSARVSDIASAMIGERSIETVVTGVRPGEKLHEILISEEEAPRSRRPVDGWYAIAPCLPELVRAPADDPAVCKEYSSRDVIMSPGRTTQMLRAHGIVE